jgi:hypothetical protein
MVLLAKEYRGKAIGYVRWWDSRGQNDVELASAGTHGAWSIKHWNITGVRSGKVF